MPFPPPITFAKSLRRSADGNAASRPLVASGIAAGLAYALQLVAYGQLMVAFVELAKRVIGAAGSLAFGRVFLREPLTGEKLAGITVLCIGIALIMFA